MPKMSHRSLVVFMVVAVALAIGCDLFRWRGHSEPSALLKTAWRGMSVSDDAAEWKRQRDAGLPVLEVALADPSRDVASQAAIAAMLGGDLAGLAAKSNNRPPFPIELLRVAERHPGSALALAALLANSRNSQWLGKEGAPQALSEREREGIERYLFFAEKGAEIEPLNGFFHALRWTALLGLGRDDEARKALRRASQCERFDTHTIEILRARLEVVRELGLPPAYRAGSVANNRYCWDLYEAAEETARRAALLEQRGDLKGGASLRVDLLRLGGLIRAEGPDTLDSLAGALVAAYAQEKLPSERRRDLSLEPYPLAHLETHFAEIGMRREALAAKEEGRAREQLPAIVKAIHRSSKWSEQANSANALGAIAGLISLWPAACLGAWLCANLLVRIRIHPLLRCTLTALVILAFLGGFWLWQRDAIWRPHLPPPNDLYPGLTDSLVDIALVVAALAAIVAGLLALTIQVSRRAARAPVSLAKPAVLVLLLLTVFYAAETARWDGLNRVGERKSLLTAAEQAREAGVAWPPPPK